MTLDELEDAREDREQHRHDIVAEMLRAHELSLAYLTASARCTEIAEQWREKANACTEAAYRFDAPPAPPEDADKAWKAATTWHAHARRLLWFAHRWLGIAEESARNYALAL